jgi:transcriptional regulator GlxA family with amidase domain
MQRSATSRLPSDVGELAPEAPAASLLLPAGDHRIRRVLGVMEREYGSRLSANRLANFVGLSRSRFEHLFKAETGARFKPALRQIRLQKAQTFLAKSSLSVKEIACRAGFLSTSAFSRGFAKWYGQAPSRWRRRHSQTGIARLDNK